MTMAGTGNELHEARQRVDATQPVKGTVPRTTLLTTAAEQALEPPVQSIGPGDLQRTRDARGEPVRQPPRTVQVIQRHLAGGYMMTGRSRRVDDIPHDQAAVVGANILTLRQQATARCGL
jgi:hypothetical protein